MNIRKRVQAPDGALPLTPPPTLDGESTGKTREQTEQAQVTDLQQAKKQRLLSGRFIENFIEIGPTVQLAQGHERASPTQ